MTISFEVVEHPSRDTTVCTYTPAGRLESEQHTRQVRYSRNYGYDPDGRRSEVLRNDALNGQHWDIFGSRIISTRRSVDIGVILVLTARVPKHGIILDT